MTLNVTIEGNIENRKIKQKAGQDLLEAYNEFANVANIHTNEWNSEWDRMHPELKDRGMQKGTDEYIEYGKYWATKCNEIFDNINDRMPESSVCAQIVSINGEILVVGVLKSDPSKYVFLGK